MNKEAYIRKSHSFTKESLEDLGILSRYMGDIGESAVLRYLIINEIRKVPVFEKPQGSKEEELAKMKKQMLTSSLIGTGVGGIKQAEALIEGLDDDAISRVLFEGEYN
jgi:hypothetical protein